MANRFSRLIVLFVFVLISVFSFTTQYVLADSPILNVSMSVSDEPLLGGNVGYLLTVQNSGAIPVDDKGYNLTITNTLPISLSFVSADPAPTFVERQPNGETRLIWDNMADLEVSEAIDIKLTAQLDERLAVASVFTNRADVALNTVPDNSGSWLTASAQVPAHPQAIDIELKANQSSSNEQVSGAGDYNSLAPGRGAGADWPYHYQLTVKNNNVGNSSDVVATAILPAGVAYLGNSSISPNPNNSVTTPDLTLLSDGALKLSWNLGTLSPVQHHSPVTIQFDTAIPYEFRTVRDRAAVTGPFAGPMSGSLIPEDTVMPVEYEAAATYADIPTSDGSQSTPADDKPVKVTAEYMTVSKSASPQVVGIGDTVTFALDYYVSEYYTATNVILTDILPDGMTYVDGSASLNPVSVQPNSPGEGQTTLTWNIPLTNTTPGLSGSVIFEATVDASYEAAPFTGQPVVSGDSLTNNVTLTNDWQDNVDSARSGNGIPDNAQATVTTRMPVFTKKVWSEVSQSWINFATGFTGDTRRFRLTYDSAVDVDAKGIIIRDFLPRGMTYVPNSAGHATDGTFTNGLDCNSAPATPAIGTLNGLQYLEWRLCNAAQGSHWEATVEAVIDDIPQVQPGWLVANFGKLSGHNTPGQAYSQRETANIDYIAPELVLTKEASPASNLVAGDAVVYTIAVTNQGEAPAYNLKLVDTLPADLLIANSGGSGNPAASSYTVSSGNPAGGAGGVVEWSLVSPLAPGDTQIFSYSTTVPSGLPAGFDMTNLASVSYNSRADNAGHQTNISANPNDLNTDDKTIYIRGVSLSKTANTAYATIGDTVHWTLNGQVPSGFIAYWLVVEENSLPAGFDYVPGSTVINGAALDTVNHAANPDDNGNNKLNWYLQTLNNSAGSQPYNFSIEFDTLVTGVNGANPSQTYYPNYCCLETTRNYAYVHWYESAAGAGSGYGTATQWDRRSGSARFDLKIRQPAPTVLKTATPANVEAGDLVTYTLTIFGAGNEHGYEMTLTDTLPAGVTFVETVDMVRSSVYTTSDPVFTDTNQAGATALEYGLDTLYVASTWNIVYTARVDDAIAAGRTLTNTAALTGYSSQPGYPTDTNGDGLVDERTYAGPGSVANQYTPAVTVLKEQSNPGELTFGSRLVYTLTVPAAPINATIYEATLTDLIDSRLQIDNVANAVVTGNTVTANLGNILPNTQQVIIIETSVPLNSSARDGDIISNTATLTHRHGTVVSNQVQQQLVAPALTLDKTAGKSIIFAGDILTYTLNIANVGQGDAQNIAISDQLPANMSYVSGSTRLDGQPLTDPVNQTWTLPANLPGKHVAILTFQAMVDNVVEGQSYLNTATVTGQDSRGQAIPADNSGRVPADIDPDDQDTAVVYSQLNWQTSNAYVAFEDLKNVSRSDWDYNDLVVDIQVELGLTSAGDVAAMRLTYDSLARGASLDHTFYHALPVEGGGLGELTVYTPAGAVVQQSSFTFGDYPQITIFDSTKAALPPAISLVNTVPGQTYTEGYTASLTIYLNDASLNPVDILPPLPWDPYIFVPGTNQEVHLVIPGHLDNVQQVNAQLDATSPLLGYYLPLAHVFETGWQWPNESIGMWRGYPEYLTYIDSGYTLGQNWYNAQFRANQWLWSTGSQGTVLPLDVTDETVPSRYFASPTLVDLNSDGQQEIILGNMLYNQIEIYNALSQAQPGWPQTTSGNINAAASVADLDGDGNLEVIVGDGDGKLYAWHHTGQAVSGWPVTLDANFRVLATPAIADLDNDRIPDVVVPLSNGKLYAFNADGSAKSGWPVSIGDVEEMFDSQIINSSPRLADLDGDGTLEIIVGSTDKKMYAFNSNGSLKWAYTTGDMVLSSPAVADFDLNRDGLEIAFGSGDSYVYLLDKDGSLIWKKRTGWTVRSSAIAADLDGNGDLEILIGGDDDKLWAWHHDGQRVTGWPQAAQADLFSSPNVGDIDGDGEPDVVIGSDEARVYAWHADGSPVTGWPQATGLAVKGKPALANLDDDAALEIVAGDFGGTLYIWNFSGTLPSTDADLSLGLTMPSTPLEVGSSLTYTLAITNSGPATAANTIVTDTLPVGTVINQLAATQGSCVEAGHVFTCTIGTMANGGQARITATVQINNLTGTTHQAGVTGSQPDPDPSNNQIQGGIDVGLSATVNPNVEQTLAYTDTGSGRSLNITVPGEAITQTTTFRYSIATTRSAPDNFSFAGQAFHLDAYYNAIRLNNFQFRQGVTVTVHYLDTDVVGLDESNLKLYYWDTASLSWQDAACGPYSRNIVRNLVSVSICHLTEFGLFGQNTQTYQYQVFLPLIQK